MGQFVRESTHLRAFLVAAWMCAALGACASGDKPPADTATHGVLADDDEAPPAPPLVATGTDTAPPMQPGFRQIKLLQLGEMSGDTLARQQLIQPGGWVYAEQQHWNSDPATPEIVVRADSSLKAPMVAYLDYWMMKNGGFDVTYAVQDSSLQGEMDCVRSEVFGMRAVDVFGTWAQVIYGYAPSGDARLGWVKLVPDRVVFTNEQESLDE